MDTLISRDMRCYLGELSQQFPVVVILGPRQSGKTTLVKTTFPEAQYTNLEFPDIRQRVEEDPQGLFGAK